MKSMLKLLFVASFLFTTHANAGYDRGLFIVNGFYNTAQYAKWNLRQYTTGYNYSCGPTSVAFIEKYLKGPVNFTTSVSSSRNKIQESYRMIRRPLNVETNFNQLKALMNNISGYRGFRRSASDGIDRNMNYLISDLYWNRPALMVLKSSWSGNPTYGTHRIDHIVIMYAYQQRSDEYGNSAFSSRNTRNNDRIYFYDPYYGRVGSFSRGEASNVTNLSGFAYLTVVSD